MIKENKSGLFNLLTTRPTYGYTDVRPNRNMWAEIAEAMGGEFKVVYTKSHDIEIHRIQIPHEEWTIEINNSDSRP